jgi:hypothetical protein
LPRLVRINHPILVRTRLVSIDLEMLASTKNLTNGFTGKIKRMN